MNGGKCVLRRRWAVSSTRVAAPTSRDRTNGPSLNCPMRDGPSAHPWTRIQRNRWPKGWKPPPIQRRL